MILKDLLKGINYSIISGSDEIKIQNIIDDSRKINKGDVFIPITGNKYDGNMFISRSIENGASAIIIDKMLNLKTENVTVILAESSNRENLPIMINNKYSNISKQFKMIGITGTNGKTSVTQMLKSALNSIGIESCTLGTIEHSIGKKTIESNNTTPGAIEINDFLLKSRNEKINTCIMEVSSHGLDQKRVFGLDFNIGVFTNLTSEHLDYHKNMENYFEAKAQLMELSKKLVINNDDSYGEKLAKRYQNTNKDLMTYGLTNKSDIYVKGISYYAQGTECEIITPNFAVNFYIPIPGQMYVYNTMAVIGIMLMMSISKEDIITSIASIDPVEGRFECISVDNEFDIIIDYAHTTDALKKIINELNRIKDKRLITIFGCGGDRDVTKRPEMGYVSAISSDIVIITSDNPRTEDPSKKINDIKSGIEDFSNVNEIIDRRTAIKFGIELAEKGDIVLIAGRGHEKYLKIENKKIKFNDREITLDILKEKGLIDEV